MENVLTKQEQGKLKAIANYISMSLDGKKLRYWQEQLIEEVTEMVQSHTSRVKTKIVEKVVYVDKQQSEREKEGLLNNIIGKRVWGT
jgi:hypothetical protein